jgi:hypothetical protein
MDAKATVNLYLFRRLCHRLCMLQGVIPHPIRLSFPEKDFHIGNRLLDEFVIFQWTRLLGFSSGPFNSQGAIQGSMILGRWRGFEAISLLSK